ncbi:phytanoyl-CoA dioxygenase family protein [Allorhodopirellula heiligendammensis]|uniref:Phytanoyl-CoA dioxygenase (PhyH) n=1 Tax=Allorhodopirellula heiligendammensis TaxID=2714739 RepID=A0A5C6C6H1_9BACT|nr:phytanoyl-CoA dioxygenase family protein [Allorhodopirellula heiligendammensis]TWU19662.1 Phytanoyl-CoA dioxygenase (PhyH) [Allorhodopirellula heiligendammensis]
MPTRLLNRFGYRIVREVVSPADCEHLGDAITKLLSADAVSRIENRQGDIVGGRNLIEYDWLWEPWIRNIQIARMIRDYASPKACVVRVLYFDKPPGQGWALSLHRDRTIAVREHHLLPAPFAKPTCKAGVPHVEATDEVMSQMLTLRLHLDPMRADNGPLYIVPRSHLPPQNGGIEPAATEGIQTIYCRAGDVFAMRPLLSHGSHATDPNTEFRRRVLHVEIAPRDLLPAPYQWHTAKLLSL